MPNQLLLQLELKEQRVHPQRQLQNKSLLKKVMLNFLLRPLIITNSGMQSNKSYISILKLERSSRDRRCPSTWTLSYALLGTHLPGRKLNHRSLLRNTVYRPTS